MSCAEVETNDIGSIIFTQFTPFGLIHKLVFAKLENKPPEKFSSQKIRLWEEKKIIISNLNRNQVFK